MRLDELLADVEPEPEALAVSRDTLPVPLEHVRELIRRDSGSGVAHGEANAGSTSRGTQSDPPAFGRELDGVGDEIRQHLEHALAVGQDERRFARLGGQIEARLSRSLLKQRERRCEQR